VRPARVEVGDVLAEEVIEVTPTENEHPESGQAPRDAGE
jgi:hypothetical protein